MKAINEAVNTFQLSQFTTYKLANQVMGWGTKYIEKYNDNVSKSKTRKKQKIAGESGVKQENNGKILITLLDRLVKQFRHKINKKK